MEKKNWYIDAGDMMWYATSTKGDLGKQQQETFVRQNDMELTDFSD